MKRIRISVVSYLNSKPFIYGLEHSEAMKELAEISLDNPAECARKVIQGEADLGLIPVAVLPDLEDYTIYSDYCIGAKGAVNSVFLFSEVPYQQIKTIVADPQSRTSVALTKVLSKFFWKIDPQWKKLDNYKEDVTSYITGETAAVLIGDRTFNLEGKYRYQYDLSEQWMLHTGLPFVFACWAGKNNLPKVFTDAFNAALESGIEQRHIVVTAEQGKYGEFDVGKYLNTDITYYLDSSKKTGMELFLKLLEKL